MSRHFDKAEGLSENHDPATHEFVFNQTMFRIKDPKRTLHFYSEVMGMTRGFGHIGFAVPDVDAACARFEEFGVPFIKKPNDGKMKGIAFIQDPDGYWIEIFTPDRQPELLKDHLA